MNATESNATQLFRRHDGPIYFNPTWFYNNRRTDDHSANLVVVPLLGLLVFLVVLCVQCCTWFRESLRDRNEGDHVFMTYAEILTSDDEDYMETEMFSDTNSVTYYDTVSSFRSFMQRCDPTDAESPPQSFPPLPDEPCDDSVFSYRKFLIRELENRTIKSNAKDKNTAMDPELYSSTPDIDTYKSKPATSAFARKQSIASVTSNSLRVKRSGSKRIQRFHLSFVDKKTVSPKELKRDLSLPKTTDRPEINKKSPSLESRFNSSPRGLRRGYSLPRSSLRPEAPKRSPASGTRRVSVSGELKRVQSLPRSACRPVVSKRSSGQEYRRKSLHSPISVPPGAAMIHPTKHSPDFLVPPERIHERDASRSNRFNFNGRDSKQTLACSVCGTVERRNSLHSQYNNRELHPMFTSTISSFDSGLPSPTGSSHSSVIDEPV